MPGAELTKAAVDCLCRSMENPCGKCPDADWSDVPPKCVGTCLRCREHEEAWRSAVELGITELYRELQAEVVETQRAIDRLRGRQSEFFDKLRRMGASDGDIRRIKKSVGRNNGVAIP